MSWIEIGSLYLAGLLAGEELVVRYAVHPALARLDARGQISTRQALIPTLRILAPVLFFSTLAATIATVVVDGASPLRWAGLAALAIWLFSTALGTVPINIGVADWDAEAPPAGWERVIARWATVDIVRSSAALLAFALLLAAAG